MVIWNLAKYHHPSLWHILHARFHIWIVLWLKLYFAILISAPLVDLYSNLSIDWFLWL